VLFVSFVDNPIMQLTTTILSLLTPFGGRYGPVGITLHGHGADALRIAAAGVEIKHLTAIGTLTGTVVTAVAARNGPGAGYLRSSGNGTWLAWRAPGSAKYGVEEDCSGGGSAVLTDGDDPDKWIRLDVHPSYLLPTPSTAQVLLGDRYSNDVAQADATAAEAAAGDELVYTLQLQNHHPTDALARVRAWLDASVSGLELSPDAVAWSAPTAEAAALELGVIPANYQIYLYLKRTIAPGASADPDVLNLIHLSFDAI
jgi:hypothetical protein